MSDEEVEEGGVQAEEESRELRFFFDGVWYRRQGRNSVLVIIATGQRVYFAGKAELRVVKGSVDYGGWRMGSDDNSITEGKQIFSCKGHSSLYCIEAIDEGEVEPAALSDSQCLEGVDPDSMGLTSFAAVVLKSFENSWTRGARQVVPDGDGFIGPEVHIVDGLDGEEERRRSGLPRLKLPRMREFMDKFGFQLMPEQLLFKNKLFVVSPTWTSLFDEMETTLKQGGEFAVPETICIFGGKSVGKSTFARWLSNKFLSLGPFVFVDLDPGQSEYTPPGVLSVHLITEPLLGPNFSHLRHPKTGVFVGGVNVADYPITYAEGIIRLSKYVSTAFPGNLPCIINTMGFSSGLGVPLSVCVVKLFRPTTVVQISMSADRKTSFPFDLNPTNIAKYDKPTFLFQCLRDSSLKEVWPKTLEYTFLKIESAFTESLGANRTESNVKQSLSGRSPRHLRDAMMVSYFADLIGSALDLSILSIVPQKVSLHSVVIGVMEGDLNYDETLSTIVGNLVVLCLTSDEVVHSAQQSGAPLQRHERHTESARTPEEPVLPKRFITNCAEHPHEYLGYGLCRAIDRKASDIFIVSPLSQEQMASVNLVISAGQVGLPPSLLTSGSSSSNNSNSRGGKHSKSNSPPKRTFIPGKRTTHSALPNHLL